MRIRVKICGLSTAEAVAAAVEHGADALGFVFAPSPRRIAVREACALAAAAPPFVARVAVLDRPAPDDVARIRGEFAPDLVQAEPDGLAPLRGGADGFLAVLHDGPDLLERARTLPAGAAVLLEGPARGMPAERGRAAALARERPLVLAGGLTPENVADAIRAVRPFGVDVSGGVESAPGVKDPARIARFLDAVSRASDDLTYTRSLSWSSVLGC